MANIAQKKTKKIVEVKARLDKEEFDAQIDEITEDLDAITNQVNEILKNARELRGQLEDVRAVPDPGFWVGNNGVWSDPALGQLPGKKAEVTRRLFETLKICDYANGIKRMDYTINDGEERVRVYYASGVKVIDVTADSGFALIKDVIRGIEEEPTQKAELRTDRMHYPKEETGSETEPD